MGKKQSGLFIGQKIVRIRNMTPKEFEEQGWYGQSGWDSCRVIELENGAMIFASRDEEGNGPGSLFGKQGSDNYYI